MHLLKEVETSDGKAVRNEQHEKVEAVFVEYGF